jgi:hypothetical protein
VVELSVPLNSRLSGRSKALSLGSLLRAGQDLVRLAREGL